MSTNKSIYCKKRDNYLDKIELVSVDFLFSISRGFSYEKTNLDKDSADLVDMETIKNDILENGLIDPFFISFSRVTLEYRLESGNNRIFLLKELGFKRVDSVVLISDKTQRYASNGEHIFSDQNMINESFLKPAGFSSYPYDQVVFEKPSLVFKF